MACPSLGNPVAVVHRLSGCPVYRKRTSGRVVDISCVQHGADGLLFMCRPAGVSVCHLPPRVHTVVRGACPLCKSV